MNRGSSASMTSGSHLSVMSGEETSSCHQVSLPFLIGTGFPVLLTTSTSFTRGQTSRASSQFFFMGTVFPPRTPSSEVMTRDEEESCILSLRDEEENPPNTTLGIARTRAQANIAMGSSGIMGG